MKKSTFFILLAFVLLAGASVQAQDTPRDVRDLVGARASSGESELQRRGYSFVKTEDGGDRKFSNWWNANRSVCITVATVNGRYQSILRSPSFDCGQTGNGENEQQVGPPTWAIGTFYGRGPNGENITLMITDAGNVSANVNGGMSYGMYISGNRIKIGNSTSRVTRQGNGIVTSSTENGERINYSRDSSGGGNAGGSGSKVNVSDLVGARASSGEAEMRNRGFRNVDGFTTGNTAYTIWWRRQSSQCIQVATANGRYDSVQDIGTHPRCR